MWEEWHSHQNGTCRSTHASLIWLKEQVVDKKFLTICSDSLEGLGNREDLLYIGLDLGLTSMNEDFEEDHPYFVFQDELSGHFARMRVNLVAARLRRMLHMLRGPSSYSVHNACDSDALNTLGMQMFKIDFDNFTKLRAMNDAVAKKLVARSPFQTLPVQQIANIFIDHNWQSNNEVRSFFKKKHSRLLGTQVVEDGFQRQRRAEASTYNRKGKAITAWRTVIEKQVLEEVHAFDRPEVPDDVLPRSAMVDPEAFHATVKGQSLELHTISSTKSQAPWYSPGVENHCVQFADLHFQHVALATGRVAEMSNVEVWGPLLNANDTIIRRKATETAEAGRWMLCLGEMKETASLTWPMNGIRRDDDSDMLSFEFARSTSLTWAVVFDVLQWEALTFSYRSPVWQLLKTDLSDSEMAIRLAQNRKVEDVLMLQPKMLSGPLAFSP